MDTDSFIHKIEPYSIQDTESGDWDNRTRILPSRWLRYIMSKMTWQKVTVNGKGAETTSEANSLPARIPGRLVGKMALGLSPEVEKQAAEEQWGHGILSRQTSTKQRHQAGVPRVPAKNWEEMSVVGGKGGKRQLVWQPGWEGGWGEDGYMYMFGWVPLLLTWNYHYIVNQLHTNKKIKS